MHQIYLVSNPHYKKNVAEFEKSASSLDFTKKMKVWLLSINKTVTKDAWKELKTAMSYTLKSYHEFVSLFSWS